MVRHCCYSTKEHPKSPHQKIFMSRRPTGDLNVINCNVSIISAITCVLFIVGYLMRV